MTGKCFSIMPFQEGFDDINRIIAEAAEECGLEYVRSDRRDQAGSVLSQILSDIRSAAVVVADISGHNPNVLYELGIAHQIKGPDRVVIIRQAADESPYDVNEFRHLVYRHNETGRRDLRAKLPDYLRRAADARVEEEMWDVIRGRLPRTRLIVRDLQRLVEQAGPKGLSGVTIRMVAGLGSLAISHRESPDPLEGSDYLGNLLAERDWLRRALLRGARLKAVLNPPRRFAQSMLPERLRARYERLIGLLEGRSDIDDDSVAAAEDIKAMEQCDFALSPVPSPNLFLIDEVVAYEGMKRGGAAGYEMTHCEKSPNALRDLIQQFDRLYEDSHRDMVRRRPPDGQLLEQLKFIYREATAP